MGAQTELDQAALDHAWRYFELHSKQRMAVFNFFVVASGAALAGVGVALEHSGRFAFLGVLLGLLVALTSFVFWKLDARGSHLIKHAEDALVRLEVSLPDAGRVVTTEADVGSASPMWTFGRAFRCTFLVVAIAGLLAAGLSAACGAGLISFDDRRDRATAASGGEPGKAVERSMVPSGAAKLQRTQSNSPKK